MIQALERRTLFDAAMFDSPMQDPELAAESASFSYPPPPENQPPTVTADNPSATANEGSSAMNTGLFSDPNYGDFVSLSASLGQVGGSGSRGSWSWTHPTPDGPVPTQLVTITATDMRGGTAQTSFDLNINNVAPTLTLSGPSEVFVGESFTIGGNSSDPGLDTITSWTVNWGDGSETFPAGSSFMRSHTYQTAGNFTISATATDEDGTFGAPPLNVLAKTDRTISPSNPQAPGASSLNRLPVSLVAGKETYKTAAVRHADGTPADATLACQVVNAVGGGAAAGVTASAPAGNFGGNYPVDITLGAGAVVGNSYNIKVSIADEPTKFIWVYIEVVR